MKSRGHEGYFNTGIQTFMRSSYVDLEETSNYDVTFLGIPYDSGCSYRKGCSLAPKYVREYSYWDKVKGDKYYDLDNEKLITSNMVKICDIGDIDVPSSNHELAFQNIETTIKKIRKKSFPLIVGGDHSIAYASIKGCIAGVNILKENIAILHFDAHPDIEDSYLDMPKIFHGNPFSSLINEGIIKPENLYSVGLRGLVPSSYYDYMRDHGINFFSVKNIRDLGVNKFINELVERLEKYEGVYISFDIDCVDPSEVKGTGTPMEGGLFSREILSFIKNFSKLKLIGFELVELSPSLDQSGLSNIVACNILRNFLAFGLNFAYLNK